MNWQWVSRIAESAGVALAISLVFNAIACGAIWLLWQKYQALQDKTTALLTDMIGEMNRRYWREKQ